MDKVDNKGLSFPQRNWLLLCIIVAILSPIVVHLLQSGAQSKNYNEVTHPVMTDTSYKMSASPGNAASTTGSDSSGKAGASSSTDTAGKASGK
jgi:cytoskeletal protein RodZ